MVEAACPAKFKVRHPLFAGRRWPASAISLGKSRVAGRRTYIRLPRAGPLMTSSGKEMPFAYIDADAGLLYRIAGHVSRFVGMHWEYGRRRTNNWTCRGHPPSLKSSGVHCWTWRKRAAAKDSTTTGHAQRRSPLKDLIL